ncbi:hypothetical protein [Paraglaciecola sp.]|uniref:hypothetical protein n=1 Tax=Paraglaciecola sp. TaxID=1920173 RepID=UPI0032659C3B
MEINSNKIWTSKEWESHANDLLRERYQSSSSYIPIPDTDGGDGGIEGFSLDGNAYQMYCAENPMTVKKLYEDQRDKMTTDIGKFINNTGKMSGYFGETKIKRWILVVPTHKSRHLVNHATKKTQEVINANLPYVDNNEFRVLIWDRNDFKREEASLLSQGIAILKLSPIEVTDTDITDFSASSSSEFNENIDYKLSKLATSESSIQRGKERLIKSAIISQNMLSELKQDYGQIYEQVMNTAIHRAEQLDIEAFDSLPEMHSLSYQINRLSEQLQNNCNLHKENITVISTGTISDWLMNCTLGFD